MKYKIQSTEKNTGLGADQETRALLYLLNDREDSNQFHWFVIDFFNDVTGINNSCTYSIDVQAKASKDIGAKQLGSYSVTLFKNFCSCLDFNIYILFVGGVGARVRTDKTKSIFKYEDMLATAQDSFKEGLTEAAKSVGYVDNETVTDDNIEKFLKQLIIVVNKDTKQEIIKRIAKLGQTNINDEKLISIFNEIRDKQSAFKNNSLEGVEIEKMSDFLPYKKYLTAENVSNLILHRLINYDFDREIPNEFNEIVQRFEYDLRADIIKQSKEAVARVLFDKNNAKNFWNLFSVVRKTIEENGNSSIDVIFNKIDTSLLENVPALDVLSAKFFIALIKEGFKNDN